MPPGAGLSGVPSTQLSWEMESPLPALVSHSLLDWQVVKPEDRRGTEWDLVQEVSATTPLSLRAQGFGCLQSQAQPWSPTWAQVVSSHCPPLYALLAPGT